MGIQMQEQAFGRKCTSYLYRNDHTSVTALSHTVLHIHGPDMERSKSNGSNYTDIFPDNNTGYGIRIDGA